MPVTYLDDDGPLFEILGVSLMGPPPVGTVHLEMKPGVNALYGLNGAGKTRILSGIQSAYSGVAIEGGAALLHFRVLEPVFEPVWEDDLDQQQYSDFTQALTDAMREVADRADPSDFATGIHWSTGSHPTSVDELRAMVLPEPPPAKRLSELEPPEPSEAGRERWRIERERLNAEWAKVGAEAGPDHPSGYAFMMAWLATRQNTLAHRIADQGVFSLLAVGGAGNPSWDIFVAARPAEIPGLSVDEWLYDSDRTSAPKVPGTPPSWMPVPLINCGRLLDTGVGTNLWSPGGDVTGWHFCASYNGHGDDYAVLPTGTAC